MSIRNVEALEKNNFKRAKFQNFIIAVGGKNGKYDKMIMKNLAKNEHVHMTIKILLDGKVDFHLKNELTNTYDSVDFMQIFKVLKIAFQDFGNFIEPFDASQGRFAKLPAILMKPPIFEVEMAKKDAILRVKEAHVFLGSVSNIVDSGFIMGCLDDWKVEETYLLFYKDGQAYRMPILSFARHMVKCLRESREFTESEQALMKIANYDQIDGICARFIRNVKRIFYFVQPLYYRILYKYHSKRGYLSQS